MSWKQARDPQGIGRDERSGRRLGPVGRVDVGPDPLSSVRAASICIASGKGGTGKSLVTASLASVFARRGRTLIVDADLGVGNAHILQDVAPEHTFVEVAAGDRQVEDIVCPCGPQLDLLAGGSGYARMAGLSAYEMHLIACGLERLELSYRYLIVDSAAGISNQTVSFAAAADIVVLVTTPDVTAMTDAYAFLKVLLQRRPSSMPLLVMNRVADVDEARAAAGRIGDVSRKFLGRQPRWITTLFEDRAAFRSIQRREPVVRSEPTSALAGALQELAGDLTDELDRQPSRGLGRTLLRRVGYSPKLT